MSTVRVKSAKDIASAWDVYFQLQFPESGQGLAPKAASKIPEASIGLHLAADRLKDSLQRLADRDIEWEGLVGSVRDKLRASAEAAIQDLPPVKVAELLVRH